MTDIQEVALVEAGVQPKSMTTMGSGELLMKSLFTTYMQGHSAICMTHPIITFRGSYNKVVLCLQSLPLRANTCATEQKLGMAARLCKMTE